jgi:uncharacterized cupredoxin-like copper-binding protein
VTAVAVLVVAGAACSSEDGDAVAVTASDDACEVATTELAAGKSTFKVTNDGGDVTEVYVYGEDDRVMGEVENVGPGTSRSFTVDLAAGEYEVACKPGMKGDGIRTPIEVTGEGGAVEAEPTETVTVEATDYSFDGLDGEEFEAGETLEILMENSAPEEEHELEVFGPDGDVLGEIGPTKPGDTGRMVLTLEETGTYRIVCGIDDHEDQGMVGTFTVS